MTKRGYGRFIPEDDRLPPEQKNVLLYTFEKYNMLVDIFRVKGYSYAYSIKYPTTKQGEPNMISSSGGYLTLLDCVTAVIIKLEDVQKETSILY